MAKMESNCVTSVTKPSGSPVAIEKAKSGVESADSLWKTTHKTGRISEAKYPKKALKLQSLTLLLVYKQAQPIYIQPLAAGAASGERYIPCHIEQCCQV